MGSRTTKQPLLKSSKDSRRIFLKTEVKDISSSEIPEKESTSNFPTRDSSCSDNIELLLEVEVTESLAHLIKNDSNFLTSNKDSMVEVTIVEPPDTTNSDRSLKSAHHINLVNTTFADSYSNKNKLHSGNRIKLGQKYVETIFNETKIAEQLSVMQHKITCDEMSKTPRKIYCTQDGTIVEDIIPNHHRKIIRNEQATTQTLTGQIEKPIIGYSISKNQETLPPNVIQKDCEHAIETNTQNLKKTNSMEQDNVELIRKLVLEEILNVIGKNTENTPTRLSISNTKRKVHVIGDNIDNISKYEITAHNLFTDIATVKPNDSLSNKLNNEFKANKYKIGADFEIPQKINKAHKPCDRNDMNDRMRIVGMYVNSRRDHTSHSHSEDSTVKSIEQGEPSTLNRPMDESKQITPNLKPNDKRVDDVTIMQPHPTSSLTLANKLAQKLRTAATNFTLSHTAKEQQVYTLDDFKIKLLRKYKPKMLRRSTKIVHRRTKEQYCRNLSSTSDKTSDDRLNNKQCFCEYCGAVSLFSESQKRPVDIEGIFEENNDCADQSKSTENKEQTPETLLRILGNSNKRKHTENMQDDLIVNEYGAEKRIDYNKKEGNDKICHHRMKGSKQIPEDSNLPHRKTSPTVDDTYNSTSDLEQFNVSNISSYQSKYVESDSSEHVPKNYQNFCVFDDVCKRLKYLEDRFIQQEKKKHHVGMYPSGNESMVPTKRIQKFIVSNVAVSTVPHNKKSISIQCNQTNLTQLKGGSTNESQLLSEAESSSNVECSTSNKPTMVFEKCASEQLSVIDYEHCKEKAIETDNTPTEVKNNQLTTKQSKLDKIMQQITNLKDITETSTQLHTPFGEAVQDNDSNIICLRHNQTNVTSNLPNQQKHYISVDEFNRENNKFKKKSTQADIQLQSTAVVTSTPENSTNMASIGDKRKKRKDVIELKFCHSNNQNNQKFDKDNVSIQINLMDNNSSKTSSEDGKHKQTKQCKNNESVDISRENQTIQTVDTSHLGNYMQEESSQMLKVIGITSSLKCHKPIRSNDMDQNEIEFQKGNKFSQLNYGRPSVNNNSEASFLLWDGKRVSPGFDLKEQIDQIVNQKIKDLEMELNILKKKNFDLQNEARSRPSALNKPITIMKTETVVSTAVSENNLYGEIARLKKIQRDDHRQVLENNYCARTLTSEELKMRKDYFRSKTCKPDMKFNVEQKSMEFQLQLNPMERIRSSSCQPYSLPLIYPEEITLGIINLNKKSSESSTKTIDKDTQKQVEKKISFTKKITKFFSNTSMKKSLTTKIDPPDSNTTTPEIEKSVVLKKEGKQFRSFIPKFRKWTTKKLKVDKNTLEQEVIEKHVNAAPSGKLHSAEPIRSSQIEMLKVTYFNPKIKTAADSSSISTEKTRADNSDFENKYLKNGMRVSKPFNNVNKIPKLLQTLKVDSPKSSVVSKPLRDRLISKGDVSSEKTTAHSGVPLEFFPKDIRERTTSLRAGTSRVKNPGKIIPPVIASKSPEIHNKNIKTYVTPTERGDTKTSCTSNKTIQNNTHLVEKTQTPFGDKSGSLIKKTSPSPIVNVKENELNKIRKRSPLVLQKDSLYQKPTPSSSKKPIPSNFNSNKNQPSTTPQNSIPGPKPIKAGKKQCKNKIRDATPSRLCEVTVSPEIPKNVFTRTPKIIPSDSIKAVNSGPPNLNNQTVEQTKLSTSSKTQNLSKKSNEYQAAEKIYPMKVFQQNRSNTAVETTKSSSKCLHAETNNIKQIEDEKNNSNIDEQKIQELIDYLTNADDDDTLRVWEQICRAAKKENLIQPEELTEGDQSSSQLSNKKIVILRKKSASSKISTDSSEEFCEIQMTLSELQAIIESKKQREAKKQFDTLRALKVCSSSESSEVVTEHAKRLDYLQKELGLTFGESFQWEPSAH